MNQIKTNIKNFISLLLLCFVSTALWAQDAGSSGVKVEVSKTETTWYTQPWVWIVGGAVFILLLVALIRGGGNKN